MDEILSTSQDRRQGDLLQSYFVKIEVIQIWTKIAEVIRIGDRFVII